MSVKLQHMISPNPNTLAVATLALPVAIVVTKQLLLTQKTLTSLSATSPKEILVGFQMRATKLTQILKNIHGYQHGGLND